MYFIWHVLFIVYMIFSLVFFCLHLAYVVMYILSASACAKFGVSS